jgi:hypothetical protein
MQLFKQIAIPGKGQGLVATEEIEKGTRVLSEPPIFSVPRNSYPGIILKAYEGLGLHAKQAFSQLHRDIAPSYYQGLAQIAKKPIATIDPNVLHVIGTYLNNSLGGHIFLQGSRINHSCTPNLEYAWNPNINQGTFHAIEHIKKGEELTISYIPSNNWTKARRTQELQRWDFACSCPSCEETMDAKVDDEERARRVIEIASLAQEEERDILGMDWTKKCRDICTSVASGLRVQGTPTREVSAW